MQVVPGRPGWSAQRHRPRASAVITTVCCGASATAAMADRRRFRRGVAVPVLGLSATAFSPDRPAKRPVGAVFRCVASRNRDDAGHSKTATCSAKTAGVGRKTAIRKQPRPKGARVAATPRGASYIHCVHSARPLATTRPTRRTSRAPHQKKKKRPCAHPLEALQNPGWSAQRHRKGRRPEGRNYPRPKLDLMLSPSYCRLVETGGRRHPRRRDATFATLTRAAAGVSRETAPSLPLLRPRSPSARLGKSFPINSSFIGLISS